MRARIGFTLVLCLALWLRPAPSGAALGFGARVDLPVAAQPTGIALADVDEDQHLDLVVASGSVAQVQVFPGAGDGTFGPAQIVTPPAAVAFMVVTDWNGDGHLDLVTSLQPAGLSVMLGVGNGTFNPGGQVALPSVAKRIAVADLDGDGLPDLAGAYGTAPMSVFVVPGAGAAGFGARVTLETLPSDSPVILEIAQLDGAGPPDLFTQIDCDGCPGRAYLNQGGMAFTPTTLGFGNNAAYAVIADFTHDGMPDLVEAQDETPMLGYLSNLALAYGNGPTRFDPYLTTPIGKLPGPIAIGPWGGASETDLVCTSRFVKYVTIQRFGCDGQPLVPFTPASLTGAPTALAIGDIDEDGTADVAVAQQAANLVSWLHVTPNDAPLACDPEVDLQTPALDFPPNTQGVTTQLVVSIHNPGSTPLFVPRATISGSTDFVTTNGFPVVVQPGQTGVIRVNDRRLTPGISTATLHITTNDAAHPLVEVPISGQAWRTRPILRLDTATLDYGTKAIHVSETRSAQVTNIGNAPLLISGASATGSEFSVLPPAPPTSLAPGLSASVTVRYERSTLGAATGTFHLASNDSILPDVQVPLSGFAGPPPVAQFSSLAPVTLPVGANTNRSLVIKNLGPSPLHVDSPEAATSLVETCPQDVGTAEPPILRGDIDGALWDIQANGTIGQGTTGEYANGMQLTAFAAQAAATLGLGGREVRLGPAAVPGGVSLTRKIFLPGAGSFARYVEVVENPGDVARPFSVDVVDNQGYGAAGPIRTSSGDNLFATLDDWIVLPPDGGSGLRTTARAVAANASPNRPSVAFLHGVGGFSWTRSRFDLTVPPRGRVAIVEWAVQGLDANAAEARVSELAAGSAGALDHLDAIDRAALWNAPAGPAVFRIYPSSLVIPPGDSALVSVTFDAASASHAAHVAGSFRIATDDPSLPLVELPVELEITGGTVVGVDPPAVPGPGAAAAFVLGGFLPNPVRLDGGGRITYRLPSSEPASITLYDLRGRVIAAHALESPSPGAGMLDLAALGTGGIRPGVVWIRLVQGGRVATRKGILLP